MAASAYFIELRVNFNDENRAEKEEILKTIAANFTNSLLANAMMLKDRSDPTVSLYYRDPEGDNIEVDLSEYSVGENCPACGHEIET